MFGRLGVRGHYIYNTKIFYFADVLKRLKKDYAIRVAVNDDVETNVKVSVTPLPIDWADVNVIVVVEIEATKQVPDIPVPETDIPTKIFEFDAVMETLVDDVVAVVEVAVVVEEIVLAINNPAE